ncbi:MAG: SWIM zinc finger family protein [Acidimicrobiia bacterium]|nr:SWIM zinc finger family protein [Acidimicrobiia bacterium]
MSDPQRHRRGKRYAADDAVLDIAIEPGIVTCEVQGSRPTPYVASLLVRSGDGMPLRRDVTAQCTCPDDDNFDGHACKHVIATMYAFSDELMIEPELLDLWRGISRDDHDADRVQAGERAAPADRADNEDGDEGDDDEDRDDIDDGDGRPPRRSGHLTLVPDRASRRVELEPELDDDPGDSLADVLAAPPGTELPSLPLIEPFDQPAPARPELAAVLRDALSHVRVHWD